MKVAVLGAGLQGTACVYDLLHSPGIQEIGIADASLERAEAVVSRLQRYIIPERSPITLSALEVSNHQAVVDYLTPFDVAISAVPYFLNLGITRAAIEAGTHLVDMGGNTDLVFEQRQLAAQAKAKQVTILPDCGLAPGMANILAAHGIAQLEQVDSVRIRVGGLPQNPQPPLNYQLFFSMHGLINEYMGRSVVLRDGQITEVDTLTEIDSLTLDTPIGSPPTRQLEAFHTLGGLSTLPWTYEGQIREMDYKTIRYPGHAAQIKLLADLGLLDETPVMLSSGQTVSPREVFAATVAPRLTFENPRDVVLVLITLTGRKAGEAVQLQMELIDHYDETSGLTAMMRTTAFPVSIVAQMLGNGDISDRGVLALECAVPTDAFIQALEKRKFPLKMRWTKSA